MHGSLYEFIRNDKLDTRNFFSPAVEPLKQNQCGGTAGGPIKHDRLFFFAYHEGYRNRQGETTSAIVPSAQERAGNFSDIGGPLVNFAAGGVPIPGNQIPSPALNPVALKVLQLYPLANTASTVYQTVVDASDNYDQAGARLDFNASARDQIFARYSFSTGYDINPFSFAALRCLASQRMTM